MTFKTIENKALLINSFSLIIISLGSLSVVLGSSFYFTSQINDIFLKYVFLNVIASLFDFGISRRMSSLGQTLLNEDVRSTVVWGFLVRILFALLLFLCIIWILNLNSFLSTYKNYSNSLSEFLGFLSINLIVSFLKGFYEGSKQLRKIAVFRISNFIFNYTLPFLFYFIESSEKNGYWFFFISKLVFLFIIFYKYRKNIIDFGFKGFTSYSYNNNYFLLFSIFSVFLGNFDKIILLLKNYKFSDYYILSEFTSKGVLFSGAILSSSVSLYGKQISNTFWEKNKRLFLLLFLGTIFIIFFKYAGITVYFSEFKHVQINQELLFVMLGTFFFNSLSHLPIVYFFNDDKIKIIVKLYIIELLFLVCLFFFFSNLNDLKLAYFNLFRTFLDFILLFIFSKNKT